MHQRVADGLRDLDAFRRDVLDIGFAPDQVADGEPPPEVLVRVARLNDAFLIYNKGNGVRDAVELARFRHCLVQNAERADDLRVFVGEQRKRDMLPVGKGLETCDRNRN